MDRETLEVECPVCDHRIPADAVRCPNCDAVFAMSGIEELQKVAREINDPATADRPSADDSRGPPNDGAAAGPGGAEGPKERVGLLGKLFKRKR